MKLIKIALGAALLASATPSAAQSLGTPQENLDCAIWASVVVGSTEDPEVRQGIGFVLNWFIGLYEGATGTSIDGAMAQRITQLDDAAFAAIAGRCAPRVSEFGARMSSLGSQLQAQGQ